MLCLGFAPGVAAKHFNNINPQVLISKFTFFFFYSPECLNHQFLKVISYSKYSWKVRLQRFLLLSHLPRDSRSWSLLDIFDHSRWLGYSKEISFQRHFPRFNWVVSTSPLPYLCMSWGVLKRMTEKVIF